MAHDADASDQQFTLLNVLCAPHGRGFRVYAKPHWMPPALVQYFDHYLEALTAGLDFDDLDEYMRRRKAVYEKHVARNRCVELTARGSSAPILGRWLATALASGVRG